MATRSRNTAAKDLSTSCKEVEWSFNIFNLYPHKTVRNVSLCLQVLEWINKKLKITQKISVFVNMWDKKDLPVHAGPVDRLPLFVFSHAPELLLFDEPTSALVSLKHRCSQVMQKLAKERRHEHDCGHTRNGLLPVSVLTVLSSANGECWWITM